MKKDKDNPDAAARRKLIEARLQAVGIKSAKNKVRMGKGAYKEVEFLPTGQPEIDLVLGEGGGIPAGTVVEFCGESQSGKTFLSLKLIAQAHKRGKRAAFMNIESSFYPPRAEALGVDIENEDIFELYENLGSAETYGELIVGMVKTGEYSVIVVDSVSAMIPEADYDKDLADNAKIGAHAQFINRFLKKLVPACADSGTIVILINQFRMGAGEGKNAPMVKQAVGGKGMEYFCHMRLWINKIYGKDGIVLNSDGERVGGKSRMNVMKTRYGTPGVLAEFSIMFTAEERDPIAEFFLRATDQYKEFILVNRKVYSYVDKETGEVHCKSKNQVEFLEELMSAPTQSKLTKGDTSTNGFEWVCGRLSERTQRLSRQAKAGRVQYDLRRGSDRRSG